MGDGPEQHDSDQDIDDAFDRRVSAVLDEEGDLLRTQAELLLATGSILIDRPSGVVSAELRPPGRWRRGELIVRTARAGGSSGAHLPLSRAAYRDRAGLHSEITLQLAVHLVGLDEDTDG